MDKEKEDGKFGKFLAVALLISGIPTLLLGSFILYQFIGLTVKVGMSKLMSGMEARQLVSIFVSVIAIPIGLVSIYHAYKIFKSKLLSKSVFYFSIFQSLILFYPIFHVYISSVSPERANVTENTVVYSVTILGVILISYSLYGFCDKIFKG